MLFSLLLANITTLSRFFFLFFVMFSNFLYIPVVKEKIKVKLVPAIPTGSPTTLEEEIMQAPPLVELKIIKSLSMKSKAATYLLNFLLYVFL